MADSAVSIVAEKLSEFLIHEAEVLSKVESRVEDIRRELMLMKAFLEHVESRGQVEDQDFIKLVEDLNDVARNAGDVIETFLDISVRKPWIFSFVKRYKVGKEVERISKRVREISKRIQSHQTNICLVVETLPETSHSVASLNATEDPAVEKLSYILSENLVANFEVRMVVKEVRDEVVSMVKVMSDLKSKEHSSEREKVWLEEANTVCNFTITVIEDFITRRSEGFPIGLLLRLAAPLYRLIPFLTLPYWPRHSEEKLMKEMKYIKTQVRDALFRRLTYGVGEEDVEDQMGWTYGADVAYELESTQMVQTLLSAPHPFVLLIKYKMTIGSIFQSIGSTPKSADQKLESIQRELALMHAFFRDIRGLEGLNERQKVWVHQMREVAQQAEALLAAYEFKVNQYKGVFGKLFLDIVAPLQFDDAIDYISYKIRNNWERKTIYDITNIEGRQGLVSLGQSMHGSGSEIEHNDNSGTEEDPLLPAGMSNNNRRIKEPIEKVVESIREDMELMKALFHDAQAIGELDGRSKIWVEEMGDIAREIESVSNEYARKFEDKPIHVSIFNLPDPDLYIIQLKINQIRSKIKEASRRRKRYGLIHLQARAESFSLVQRLYGRTKPPLNVRESKIIGFDEDVEVLMGNVPLYLRRCLSYFVLFPAEFEIPTRRLIALWVAEGLVHHGQDQESPEQVAERCLAELIDLNMVQIAKRKHNGKVKTCCLPNALRESPFLQRHTSTDSDSVSKKSIIRQVADQLDKNDICYNHIHSDTITASSSLKSLYKEVLSFLSFDAREGGKPGQEIGRFLNRCISRGCFLQLRVLDLERVYKPQLPENMARLSRLRYLGLRWTYLESLPSSISSLLKLQTLDLKHTYISILPNSIWKMQLRHLFLSETYRSRFQPHPKGNSLSDIQTLWGLFVDEKTPVKGGLDRLVNIRKLGLACQSMSLGEEMTRQLVVVAKWIMNLKYLQSLRLRSRKEDGQPGDLHLWSLKTHADLTDMYLLGILKCPSLKSLFPTSLVELTLSHSNLQQDSIEILGDLPLLQSLCLLAGSYIEETLHCKKGSFPQLYVLKFWKLKELEEWIIEEKAFPNLRQLEIRSCECLQMLPDGLKHINTICELKLTTMSENFMERVRGVDKNKIPSSCNVFHCYIIAGEQQFTCNRLF